RRSQAATMFKGSPIFEIMNLVGYDAAGLGTHEFDHGFARIALFRDIATHPVLAANAFAPDGTLIADAPFLIRKIGNMHIGIIGLITDDTPRMITPIGNEHLDFADPTLTARDLVAALRKQVDLLIVLAHLGHEHEKQLAKDVPGIDLIVGGRSHTLVDPPVRVGDTWVVQADRHGSHIGYLEIEVDTKANRIASFDGVLIPAGDLPAPDKHVMNMVAAWDRRVSAIVDVSIAESDSAFTTEQTRTLLEHILAEAAGTPFGYYNLGGVRDVVPKGGITVRHIWSIEPFGNTLVRVTTDGATMKRIVTMDGETHATSKSFDPDGQYTFATNSFVADQANVRSPGKITVEPLNVLVRDVMIDYIQRHGIEAP
ncbi:MAG: 5'-nucleotidase C-terminal domain-containing protein, partial [Pseudomonadota bacterium]